jgi:hypothetical protein
MAGVAAVEVMAVAADMEGVEATAVAEAMVAAVFMAAVEAFTAVEADFTPRRRE